MIGRLLPGWFTHLPDQSQYNRRLRRLTPYITPVQLMVAELIAEGRIRLADGTRGASVFTPDLPNAVSCCGPAVRLRHVLGFPQGGLLRGLRRAPRPSAGIGPCRTATSDPARTGRFPRSP